MKEEEVRPKKVFDNYIKLAIKDTKIFFNESKLNHIACISCGKKGRVLFNKHNFQYHICDNCFSIYVCPRPNQKSFNDYYKYSSSSKFWAETFYKVTAKSRIQKIWKPKVKKILYFKEKYFSKKDIQIIDIGGGYGLFADEISKFNKNISIIEPAPHLANICKEKGHNVINKFFENISSKDLKNSKKLFVSFELIEHLHSPKKFFQKLHKLLSKKDIFVFTTLSGMGLDIVTLGIKSKSIMPPYHLNFFNPYSIGIFLDKLGFQTLEITTPGKLDIDILKNNRNILDNLLFKYIFKTSDEKYLKNLQNFISKFNLSSHMMIVCKKK